MSSQTFHFSLYLGKARFQIKFLTANVFGDAFRLKCDPPDGRSCDVYVKVQIGDIIVDFKPQRQTLKTKRLQHLNWEYTTPEPISKNSEISIQMYDHDDITSDDLMAEWTLTPDQIGERVTLSTSDFTKNHLTILAKWLDE